MKERDYYEKLYFFMKKLDYYEKSSLKFYKFETFPEVADSIAYIFQVLLYLYREKFVYLKSIYMQYITLER